MKIKGDIKGTLELTEDTEIIGDVLDGAKIITNGYRIYLTGTIRECALILGSK